MTTSGEVSRGEKMALKVSDPDSYITEYTLVYEDKKVPTAVLLCLPHDSELANRIEPFKE